MPPYEDWRDCIRGEVKSALQTPRSTIKRLTVATTRWHQRIVSAQEANVLVFNPGSASLKFEVIASERPQDEFIRGRKLLRGVIEPIGGTSKLYVFDGDRAAPQLEIEARDHGQAAERVLDSLDSGRFNGVASTKDIQIVGHRVVHGGGRYWEPVRIDEQVIEEIEALKEIAPLHNAAAAAVIRTTHARLGNRIPAVAVFDTGFYRELPERAYLYGLPWEVTQRYGIRRYGFHGISHQYMMLRYAEITGTPVNKTRIISLHLEGGSSATAVVAGKPADTSMGFTPLEGLMMGTRSGDIDPALVAYLAEKQNASAGEIVKLLNKQSGMLGLSGRSQDTRVLVKHLAEDRRSDLALEVFAYRVRKYIGAYLAATGGVAAVVFGGGISENTPEVRRRTCEGLDWLGLDFDPDRNAATIDREGRFTREGSRLEAWVIPTQEGMMIAHEALRCCWPGE